MFDRTQIHEGMAVRAATGHKLGRVVSADEGTFRVERRGLLGVRRYPVRYTDIQAIDEEGVVLRVDEDELRIREEGDARISGDVAEVSVERDSLQMGGEEETRYEEYSIRVSEDGGTVERRSVTQHLGGSEEHARQRTVEEAPPGEPESSLAPDALPGTNGGTSEHP